MAQLGVADNDSIKSLFVEYEPAFSNLFSVSVYSAGLDADRGSVTAYSKLHATGISFVGAGITLKRHNVTKLFALDKYQRSDVVTITWREDKNFSVRAFHEAWLANFYDKKADKYISYESDTEANNALLKGITINIQDGIMLKLVGVLPQKIPDLTLSWESPNIITYSLSYYVTSWSWGKV